MKLCRALSDLVVYTNSVAAQDIVDDGKDAGARLTRAFLFSVLIGSISDLRVSLVFQRYFKSRVKHHPSLP